MKPIWVWLAVCATACGDDGAEVRDDAGVDIDAADVDADPGDTIAPSVVAVTPATGTTGVTTTSTVTVTFSEAMNPATLASAITLSPQTAATVTWDEPTLTATFTPSAPLVRGARYMVDVSVAATDMAGNALASAHASSFSVEIAAPARIDTGGAAIPNAPKVVYDDAGNGVAVWTSQKNFQQSDVLYATYTAANTTWAPEAVLAANVSTSSLTLRIATNGDMFVVLVNGVARSLTYDAVGAAWTVSAATEVTSSVYTDAVALVSNGTTFMAAWEQPGAGTRAALFNGTAWSANTTLSETSSSISLRSLRLATDGDAYAVAWVQRSSNVDTAHYIVYEASQWRTLTRPISASVTDGAQSLELAGATDGTGFIVVWEQAPPFQSNDVIYVSRWVRTLGNTGGASLLTSITTSTSDASTPHAAAGNGTWGVVWRDPQHIRFALWNGTSWDATEQATANTGNYTRPVVLRVGPRFAVFVQNTANTLFGRIRNAGTWETEVVLTTAGTQTMEWVATASGGFGVVQRDVPATGIASVVRTLYQGGAWGTPLVVSSTATLAVEDVFIGERGNAFATSWMQDGHILVRAGANNETLDALPHPAQAIISGSAASGGRTVVTWRQGAGHAYATFASLYSQMTGWSAPTIIEYQDSTSALVSGRAGTFVVATRYAARYHGGGAWSASLDPSDGDYEFYELAANADEHLVTYVEYDDSVFSYRTTSDGTWSASGTLPYDNGSSDYPRGLIPSAHGFLALWEADGDLRASRFDGTTWSTGDTLTDNYNGTPVAASNGTNYAVAFTAYDSNANVDRVYATVYDGTGWSTPAALGDIDNSNPVRIVSNGTGYAVMWRRLETVNVAIYTAQWTTTELDDAADTDAYGFELQSDGAGYLAVWTDAPLAYALWDGVMWSAPVTVASDEGWFSAGGPSSYRLGLEAFNVDHDELHAHALTAAGMSPAIVLDNPSDVSITGVGRPSALWNGYSFAVMWTRGLATDLSVDGLFGTGGF